MAVKVMIPRTGYGANEPVVGNWVKVEGDRVQAGEVIAEVEAEKAVVHLEAPASGVLLRILHPAGDTVPVGKPIAVIGEPGEDISSLLRDSVEADKPEPAAEEPYDTVSEERERLVRKRAMPAAKRLAREHGVDLSLVEGTGPEGVITKDDVAGYVEGLKDSEDKGRSASDQVIPLKGARKVIADHMSNSKRTAAHVTTTCEADVTDLMRLRQGAKTLGPRDSVPSITSFVVKACAMALREFPIVNSSLVGDSIVLKGSINIGVAVSVENGLVVPVIRDADRKTVPEISREIGEMSAKARTDGLSPQDMEGGTFTVSNAGIFDVHLFTPIIRQPESAILGLGSVYSRPWVVDRKIEVREIMSLCLSYDHRVMNGADAAGFLAKVKAYVQNVAILLA
jgi:pyruvate dehydrogenase E2 component (dihydrolipoamide acetyltransferase)